MNAKVDVTRDGVAVIGMGCWYPGANSLATLWENILTRRQQFRRFPDSRLPLADYHDPDTSAPDKTYGSNAAVIDGFVFDWAKRRIPKTVVDSTDIVHWLALEVALQALQDSGYTEADLPAAKTGVLVGNTLTGEHTRATAMRQRWPYVRRALKAAMGDVLSPTQAQQVEARLEHNFKSPFKTATEDSLAGGLSNTIAGRICNFLNLQGGGFTVDGACASSLIAVANAAALVASGELDMAFAGGVDVSLDTFEMIGFAKTGALTQTAMTVYDRRGSGFIPGEGCGFALLKRFDRALADGDKIYAVLRGWGISSDGKGGLTAPKAEGQALALERAYRRAGYGVQDLTFIEGHGTGTTVGDRVELQGMALAAEKFGSISPRSVGVTSFKSLVGHTKAAAGVGGFIKAVLGVNARIVPPTVGCDQPHSVFEGEAKGFYPVTAGQKCEATLPIRAGVSGSGFGGINCHVTLESGPGIVPVLPDGRDETHLLAAAQESEVFLLSSSTQNGLLDACRALGQRAFGMAFGEMADLAAECARLPVKGRFRAALVASTPDDLADKLAIAADHLARGTLTGLAELSADLVLSQVEGEPRIAFLFPGQGSQQINMARRLVQRHVWAQDMVNKADRVLVAHGFPAVSEVMFRPLERAFGTPLEADWRAALTDTRRAQVALCLAALLQGEFLRRLGVKPAVVAGHSLGELSALAASGALSDEHLILLAAERGAAMAEPATGARGSMAMLACDEAGALALLAETAGYLVIACVNSPKQTVVSGEAAAIETLLAQADAKGIKARALPVSNAFHSKLIEGAASRLAALDFLPESAPLNLPFVSALDGSVWDGAINLRDYCARQVLAPVRFADVVASLNQHCDLAIEVGPARALSGFVADCAGALRCLPIESQPGADRDLNRLVGQLFVRGTAIDAAQIYADRLIRPFIPASERVFIDNPCERPFAPFPEPQVFELAEAPARWIGQLAEGLGTIPPARMAQYLAKRGRFLERVVLADMDHEGLAVAVVPAPKPASVAPVAVAPTPSTETTALARLITLVAETTGFAEASLSPGLRLLDDLNLDSIKAGELVARLADACGVAGQVDPAPLLNAPLSEVASAVEAAGGVAQSVVPVAVPIGALDLLVQLVAEKTGFAAASLNGDLRMLDDLNLDSIKSAELIADVAARLGVSGALDPAQFANASLREAATALQAAAPAPALKPHAAPKGPSETGVVRCYGDRLVNTALEAGTRELAGTITVLAAREAAAKALAKALSGAGRTIQTADFSHAGELVAATHLIVLLSEGDEVDAALQISAAMALENTPDSSLTYVVTGGVSGAAAFAASLHLERPNLRVRVIETSATADNLAQALGGELSTGTAFAHAIFAPGGTRQTRQWHVETPTTLAKRQQVWGAEDVILVTGGAKGITAECALALAQETGARMVLVGSSPHSDAAPDKAIGATLARYAALGLTARYAACDIADRAAVAAMIATVRTEFGAITGVLHGAGLNRPRRAETVSLDDARREIAPKLLGAQNLLDLLGEANLKAFCALTSIIGVTGMAGNAWYAYSNQLVDKLVADFGARHPDCAAFSVAYSVWDEVGMGARMGSTTHLARMGIGAIPPTEGIRQFLALWQGEAVSGVNVVAAALGGLDTWVLEDAGAGLDLRFIEEVRAITPGVELIARAHLDPARDLYLKDHDYKGSLLFPTVFGMEAMAQAAARLLGTLAPFAPGQVVWFEDVQLTRPIVVPEGKGNEIELHAQREADGAIRVGIRTAQTGFGVDHFAARLVLGGDMGAEAKVPDTATRLDLDPAQDLYGPLLFQGPRFQRMGAVHELGEEREFEGSALLSITESSVEDIAAASFAFRATPVLLGDAYARDAVLQSGQLLMPRHLCLPIAIARAGIRCGVASGPMTVETHLQGREDRDVTAMCTLRDQTGVVVHHLEGYRVRILEEKPENPSVADLAGLEAWENRQMTASLAAACTNLGLESPDLRLFAAAGLHGLKRDERHAIETTFLARMWDETQGGAVPSLSWQDDGKPVLEGDLALSISHDERSCLLALGTGALGCDLTPITPRTRADWIALLGAARAGLIDQICAAGDDLDTAASRIWASREALIKAGDTGGDMRLVRQADGAVVLASGEHHVLSLVLRAWGAARVLALTVTPDQTEIAAPLVEIHGEPTASTWTSRDEHGVLRFHHRFSLMMDDVGSLSRAVPASRYFAFMGKVRELALAPVMAPLAEAVGSGLWGAVTNSSDLRVYGEAHGSDKIIGTVQAIRLPDSTDATIDLQFDWARADESGTEEVIASSLMRTSWVKVRGHGQVDKHPLPDFLRDFLTRIGERKATSIALPESGIASLNLGAALVSFEGHFGAQPVLSREVFDTDQEDSNLVGNIYHSNYAKWCGRVLDRFLFRAAPDHFRQAGRAGEWLTQSLRLTYLRDAMPFDRIETELRLSALHAHGARLVFVFSRLDGDGRKTKLAQAEGQVIWIDRNATGQPAAAVVPAVWISAFQSGAREHSARGENVRPRDQVYQ